MNRKYINIAVSAILIWIGIILASVTKWSAFGFKWDFSNTGAFGDSFGPLSASMAALAAYAAFQTLSEQRSEIERLRTREKDEDDRQNKAEFERTFFQLLQSFREIMSLIDIDGQGGKKQAHDAFKSILYYFESERSRIGAAQKSWNDTAKKYKNDLNHYFRSLYHIIKFVDSSQKISDKYFYTSIVRSGISDSELNLIALNCAFGEGKEKFKNFIEKYSLLHNLDEHSPSYALTYEIFEKAAFDSSVHGITMTGATTPK